MIRQKKEHRTGRCCYAAALLVMICVLVSMTICSPAVHGADGETDRAPKVIDWGLFDLDSGTERSLNGSGVIDGDTIDGVFYIRFDHNVSERVEADIADANCDKISVVSNDGRPVAAEVWVKDTQLEFQYRQYIFVTVTGAIDPGMDYHIVVAPGITAKNGYTNTEGSNLFFSFTGSGEAPVDPGGEGSDVPDPQEPVDPGGKSKDSQEQQKSDKKSSSKKKNSSKSKSSKTRTQQIQKTNRPTAGNTAGQSATLPGRRITQSNSQTAQPGRSDPAQNSSETETLGFRVSDELAEKLNGSSLQGAGQGSSPEEERRVAPNDIPAVGLAAILSLFVCLAMIGAGAAAEDISFRKRLHPGKSGNDVSHRQVA